MAQPPAFAADAMLGTLAKWLRLLGHDCFYERDIDDGRLLEVARSQRRVLLTRDRRLAGKYALAVFVPPGDIDDELLWVHKELALAPPDAPPTTRCSLCNALLVLASPQDLDASGLPARIRQEHEEIWRCPACARLYWEGTHVASMVERLTRLRARLGSAPGPSPPG